MYVKELTCLKSNLTNNNNDNILKIFILFLTLTYALSANFVHVFLIYIIYDNYLYLKDLAISVHEDPSFLGGVKKKILKIKKPSSEKEKEPTFKKIYMNFLKKSFFEIE